VPEARSMIFGLLSYHPGRELTFSPVDHPLPTQLPPPFCAVVLKVLPIAEILSPPRRS